LNSSWRLGNCTLMCELRFGSLRVRVKVRGIARKGEAQADTLPSP
jgi:hypothetical protein